ncbi:glucose-1-phosphate adenylyltransferase, partial [Aeromonas caviae]
GAGCRLRRVVVDKGCKLPDGLVVGENADEDSRRFYRSEQGIVLVTKPMLAKLG